MNRVPGALAALVLLVGASCGRPLPAPVPVEPVDGVLDLRALVTEGRGPVLPELWTWDPDVLWSPETGRPGNLPPAVALPGPDRGGVFERSLMRPYRPGKEGGLSGATATLTLLTDPAKAVDLRIGALPGAQAVWANGVEVFRSGRPSLEAEVYQAGGGGAVVTLQPREGRIDLVVQVATSDPLIRHPEANRLWMVAPAGTLAAAEAAGDQWRIFQVAFLVAAFGILAYLSARGPGRRGLGALFAFLGVCALKLVVQVEGVSPLLGSVFPWIPGSFYLLANHALNLVPFALLVQFIDRRFPGDLDRRTVVIAWGLTAFMTLWELLPFVLLAFGWEEPYTQVMGASWSLVLNGYVVLAVLFIVERLHHLAVLGRPLARSLLAGGGLLGLVVLIPIPMSYFLPVPYTYFLGWGLLLFVGVLGVSLVRHQLGIADAERSHLDARVTQAEAVGRFLPSAWAGLLGKRNLEGLRPGDRRPAAAVVLQVRSSQDPAAWLAAISAPAAQRSAVLLAAGDGQATWILDIWSEGALALALEQFRILTARGIPGRVVLLRSLVEFRILDADPHWWPAADQVPWGRLNDLHRLAEAHGAGVLLDESLQDGLVIGGWRRHRHLTPEAHEIELFEAEEPALAALKEKYLEAYARALNLARSGRLDEARQVLFDLAQLNPFDQGARTLLSQWGLPPTP